MSLLQLPPETLTQVMDYVGPSYFREDSGRLIVCKQWFTIARTVCFKDLQLSPTTLRRLLSSRDVERSLLLVEANLEILDLQLKGFEDWSALPRPFGDTPDTSASDASGWDTDLGRASLAAWTTVLDDDLAQLSLIAKGSRKLRTLRIRTLSESHPRLPYLPRRDYLSGPTIRALLTVDTLTVLDLDLCGTLLTPRRGRSNCHICASVGTLLTTLRRLRLRMRRVCPDILRPQPPRFNLRLSEVLINLSLSNESPMTTSVAYPARCGSTGGGFAQLQADIEHQAKALVAHMASPQTVRILTHSLPQLEMQSFDVLAGKRLVLGDHAAWDDDGQTIEDNSDVESAILESGSGASSGEEGGFEDSGS